MVVWQWLITLVKGIYCRSVSMDHADECNFTPVNCPNHPRGCIAQICRSQVKKHLSEHCPFRDATCLHCDAVIPATDIKAHIQDSCPQSEVECPNGCNKTVKRRSMAHHVADVCEKTVKKCPYMSSGCHFKGLRKELAEHLQDSMHVHLGYLAERSSKLEDELKRSEKEKGDLKTELANMSAHFETMAGRLAALELRVPDNSAQNAVSIAGSVGSEATNRKVEKALEKAEKAEASCLGARQTNEQCLTRLSSLDRQVSNFSVLFTRTDNILSEFDLRLLSQETTSYNGVLIWKIPDYTRHFEEARLGKKPSLYSPPFYTSRHGYKMCARVYLNGDGVGRGTHLSLFFVVMKGEFEALLPWPFHQKVTLTLLDQSPARRHISDTFMPDPRSLSFQRPATDMNVASGCPCFISLDALRTGLSYTKDNILFVRIAVDTSGLPNY